MTQDIKSKAVIVGIWVLAFIAAYVLLGPYFGGMFAGGSMVTLFLTILMKIFLKKKLSHNIHYWFGASVLLAYLLASTVYSYGAADGGPPRFAEGFLNYLLPAVFVWVMQYVGDLKSKDLL